MPRLAGKLVRTMQQQSVHMQQPLVLLLLAQSRCAAV
jgi:hypothetical protein